MKLMELKGIYDGVFSLGSSCYPAQRLERYQLRPYSGVIDWMSSRSAIGLIKLIQNRFHHFMHPHHIWVEGTRFNGHNYSVRDCRYDIHSVHDFLTSDQLTGIVQNYPEFQQKLERRIARFLDKTGKCKRLLFMRLNASYDEAQALESALRSIVVHDFSLLVVNPGSMMQVVEKEWPLVHTCGLELPIAWDEASDRVWSEVFNGIHYSEPDFIS